jgi:hypothetical protein
MNESLAGGPASSDRTAGNFTVSPPENITGKEWPPSKDVSTGTRTACEEAAADEGLVESLTPSLILSGGVVTEGGTPYDITLGSPLPHILNENPVEFGALYAKMYGLTMPGGQRIDMCFKTTGYEY